MSMSPLSTVLGRIRAKALAQEDALLSDGQLLDRYLANRNEQAFAALVRRHGPMVLGVCRRIATHEQDAEDAFQATFLVLVRKAASVAPRERVGNWLYGVACRTAMKARAMSGKRRARERQAGHRLPAEASGDLVWSDLQPVLDEELDRWIRHRGRCVQLFGDLRKCRGARRNTRSP